jgi:hypothetical protein
MNEPLIAALTVVSDHTEMPKVVRSLIRVMQVIFQRQQARKEMPTDLAALKQRLESGS